MTFDSATALFVRAVIIFTMDEIQTLSKSIITVISVIKSRGNSISHFDSGVLLLFQWLLFFFPGLTSSKFLSKENGSLSTYAGNM